RLLEMYCGCGAHTIPLAKSALLSEIVAVELDERLANACRRNCRLNGCDAAEWAKKTLKDQSKQRTNTKQPSFNHYNNFDILLVDPPREGLDKIVCDLAINKGTFQHVVYISCGRVALLRDLDILCKGGFNVVNLAVIDLFPGTDAVESLVHLRR
ncbi:RNA methyltransferase, partial [Thalassiosira pseudonana CCMP1335]